MSRNSLEEIWKAFEEVPSEAKPAEKKEEKKKPEEAKKPAEAKPEEKPKKVTEPVETKPEATPAPSAEAKEEFEIEEARAEEVGEFFGREEEMETKAAIQETASATEAVAPSISVEAQIPKVPMVPTPKVEEHFDFTEAESPGKEVYMIYGLKGEGKTALAFSFPGKIACLSFDRKSVLVKDKLYRHRAHEIKVYDAVKYLDSSSPEKLLESSEKTFRYINALLDRIAEWKPDWIVIDGSEILQTICEMTMRYRNNLMPFQGIANRNLWKERRMYIRQIHHKALTIARKGVIYTAYTDYHEIVQDGEFVLRKEVPRWIDAILYETDVVIHVTSEVGKDKAGRRFYAEVESSKGRLPTGVKKDVTGLGIAAFGVSFD
jgi:hypothetical protein